MTETDGPHAARYDAILADPRYQRLVQRRGRLPGVTILIGRYFGASADRLTWRSPADRQRFHSTESDRHRRNLFAIS